MKKSVLHILLLCMMAVCLVSCSDKEDSTLSITEDTYTVALVLPLERGVLEYEETLSMFKHNLETAQQGCRHKIKLNVEMYDEDKENLSQLANTLAKRKDIKAVIGPVDQGHLDQMCRQLKNGELPLIAINVGSTELARNYVSRNDFFWALTQTDITKLEIMLTTAAKSGTRRFDLICANSGYTAQTYKDWFGFEVSELGLNISGNNLYSDSSEIRMIVNDCFDGQKFSDKAIICVPNNEDEATIMINEIAKRYNALEAYNRPKIYFSDNVMNMNLEDVDDDAMGFYVVSPTADPHSGFAPGYKSATSGSVNYVEAQLYDALMLTSFALANKPDNMIESLKEITSLGDDSNCIVAWTPEKMGEVFLQMEHGNANTHIAGASSTLYFDEKNHTCVTESYYMLGMYHYIMLNPIAYYSADGNSSSKELMADWEWQSTKNQTFEGVTYKQHTTLPLHERWAVVVASSEGFENYRHQADALNVYQHLRENGYDDDHILLVMADDIANSPDNKRRGEIWGPDSTNLYHDLKIDYHVKDLTPEQIMDKIAQLPCNNDDDVLVFWSGHGKPGALMWGEKTISPELVASAQERLNGHFRKMAWFIEACYSGCIGEALVGFDNVIAMTAANANETSKAYLMNYEVGGVSISNRFSAFLISSMKERPYYTFKDLYSYLCVQTIGSHVMLYNYANYGNISTENASEYFYNINF